ncbi:MAG: L-seryl-tRNA(Sec) selenium transferase [Actinobacteria bacterium]|nr:L-seryl-tRNA(Sec) selenium transferase [Actinomycetota bacterium]
MDKIDSKINNYLRKLPKVDEVLDNPSVKKYLESNPRELVVDGIRTGIEKARKLILSSKSIAEVESILNSIEEIVIQAVKKNCDYHLKPVINATGIVLHTNLGRAPLHPSAIERIKEVSIGYSNLEYELDTGKRGSRYSHVEELLKKLCGVESAFVVNNNASAVLLALNTFASGKEVIVSRGEMIEIGGSFRIPEIMKISGATLVEVGTTNKTHLKDYEDVISENTALILKVHPSNYRIVGFTKEVTLEELVDLGRKHNVPVMYDAGSGALLDFNQKGFKEEPAIQKAVKAGVDVITFSGDKLLGGPQAGIIVGRKEFVEKMKRNHLNRALRIDKLTLAALEATLRLYLEEDPWQTIPVLRMLSMPAEEVKKKARKLKKILKNEFGNRIEVELIATVARSGGGALPDIDIPSYGVALSVPGKSSVCIEQSLRHTDPPVIVLVQDEKIIMDARTLLDGEEKKIISALKQIVL